jgi:copper resistance protein B
VRLRYQVTRRVAPYVGLQVERAFGDTARLRALDGHDAADTRLVVGLHAWF